MAGTTWTWIGTTSDPTQSTNWSPNGQPQPGDTAIIPGGTTVPPNIVNTSLTGVTFDLVNDGSLAFSNTSASLGSSEIDAQGGIDATGSATALSLAGPFTNLGTIEVAGTQASLDILIAAGSEASGILNNQGQIIVGPTDRLAINGGTILDPGTIVVDGGTATITGTLEGTGNYAVGTGGTLELDQAGSFASTQITFTGTTGLVKLDDPEAFDGSISGFALGDTIDLGPVNVSTVVFDNQGDVIAIGSGGTVFDANLPGSGNSGTFVLSGTAGVAGDLQLTEGGGDTVLTMVPPSTWLWSNGASAPGNTTSDWSVVSGPGNGWGYPQPGDTAIDAGGTIVLGDSNFEGDTLELGGTAGLAALSFISSSNTNIDRPTLDSSSVITSNVTSVGTFVGNSTPETSLLNAQGIFINDGTIAADGPAGSSFTIAVSGTMIDGTYQPGEFINYGLIQVDAGNSMTIAVAGTSELSNVGEIVANGGTLVYNAATDAIIGGYAPGSGVVFIEDGGTVDTNVTYASDVNGDIPTYAFAGSGTGNTLKIDTIGLFGGAILGFEANDTIDIGTSIDVTAIAYDNSTGVLSLESGGTIAASLLLATGNFQNYSGTVSGGTADGFIIGTSATDGDTIITTAVQNDVYDNTTGTWQTAGQWSNGVPGPLDTAVIGVGASAPFTLTTGASPVSVGAVVLAGDDALLQITSDTTASPYQIHQYGGTLEVTSGNTLTGTGMIVDGGQTTIDPTALLDLTGRQTYGTTGAVDGTITAISYGAQALRIDSGSVLVNGGTLDAGPGQAGGGTGGRIYIGFEGGGTPATMTVQNSGTDAGVVTDTYAILASDPTSFGVLTLDGNVSWTDEITTADTQGNRGYMVVGFNNQATISGTLTPAFSGTATLVVENGATLTEQAYAEIGASVDSSGSVLVSGAGALWSIGTTTTGSITGGFLDVGKLGDGVLTVEDGGIVEVGGSLEGFINNGSLLSASGINVGVSAGSFGTLDIESDGTVAMLGDAGIGIGLSAQATGLIIVNGPGALLSEGTAGGGIGIGKGGTGTLEIEGGGTVDLNGTADTGGIGIGQTLGATGLVVVAGSGSLLDLNTPDGSVHVGDAGQGTLEVQSGGTVAVTGTGVVIGVDSGGSGTVTVSGADSSLLSLGANGGMIVGDAGAGVLDIGTGTGSGGSVSAAARLLIANAGTATGTVTVDGGTLTVGGSLVVGSVGSGTLDVKDGGVVQDTGTSGVYVGGSAAGADGIAIVNGGTLTDTSGYFGVGNTDASGTLLVDGGGTLITGGVNAISDINATGSGQTAVATVSDGTWVVNWQMIVGDIGTGSLDINSDGLVNAGTNFVDIGNQTGGSGMLSLESGGVLQAGSLTIDSDASLGAIGHVTVAGGTVTVVGLSEDANAAITVSSGSLSVSGTGLIGQQGTGATLTMTGGDATFGGLIVGYVPGTSGTVTVSGGTLDANGMIIGDGGDARVTVNADGSLAVTNALQLDNESDVPAGTAGSSALVVNGGSVTAGGGLTIGEGGTAFVTIEAGGTLAATSGNDFSIGGDLVSPGTAAVTVSDGLFTASGGALLIGDGGNASMLVENAGTVVTTYTGSGPGVEIDTPGTAQASVTVTGTGSVWDFDASGAQFVVGDTGGGSLTINDGGVVNVGTNTVDIGNQAGGSGSVDVQGGTLASGDIVVGNFPSSTGDTLTVGSFGLVAASVVNLNDLVSMAGGTLQAAIQINGTGSIAGYGTVATPEIIGGQFTANGGTLEVTGAIVDEGGTADTFVIDGGAAFRADGALDSTGSVNFAASTSPETLILNTPGGGFANAITGLNNGDVIELNLGGSTITNASVTSPGTVTILSSTGTYSLTDVGFAAGASQQFVWGTDSSTGDAYVEVMPCFAAGTGIATPRGRKRVEELAVGDTVRTVLDRRPRPIVWIGHRTVDCTRHPRPQLVWPVCVSAGAFGRGLPTRDLYLSPDHAVYANGVLIPVKRLVNGETVTQVPCDSVTYYHIELTRHDVVLSEGLPAESFLDTGDRANFANGGPAIALYPDFSSHVREAEGCAELIVVGPKLDAMRARLDRIASGRRAASKQAA